MKKPFNLLINSSQQLILRPVGDGMLLEILMPMRPQDASMGMVTQVILAAPQVAALRSYLDETDYDRPPAA